MAQQGRETQRERRLPNWLALLLVLLLLGGASWGILALMKNPAPKVEAVAVDQPGRAGRDRNRALQSGAVVDQGRRALDQMTRRAGQFGAGPTTSPARRQLAPDQSRRANALANDQSRAKVFKRPEGGIRVLSGKYILYVDPQEKGGRTNLEYVDAENWLSGQQLAVLRIAETSQQQGTVRPVELTEEQLRQSKVVTTDPVIALDDPDRARLEQLAKAWDAADQSQKPAAQEALLAGLKEVARKNVKTAREGYVANVDKLAAMLTPQQKEQFRQIEAARRTGRNPPSIGPTTRTVQGA